MVFHYNDIFIDKNIIEENLEENDIFSHYLYPVDFTKRYRNPLRGEEDEHPGCKYYITENGTIKFIDFSMGKSWNCYSYIMELYEISFYECLKLIYHELIEGVEVDKIAISNKKKLIRSVSNDKILRASKKDFSVEELKWWSKGGINSEQKDLEDFGIYSAKCYWINDRIFENQVNTYIYIGQNNQIDQIYSPNRDKNNFRFINRSGFKYNLNPIQNGTDTFFLSKSKKCSYFLSRYGYQTGYMGNESLLLDSESVRWIRLNYKYIYVMGDNDETGENFMKEHYEKYHFIPTPVPQEKDLTDFLEKYGYLETLDFLNSLKDK